MAHGFLTYWSGWVTNTSIGIWHFLFLPLIPSVLSSLVDQQTSPEVLKALGRQSQEWRHWSHIPPPTSLHTPTPTPTSGFYSGTAGAGEGFNLRERRIPWTPSMWLTSHREPTRGPLESEAARWGPGPSLGSLSALLHSIPLHWPLQPPPPSPPLHFGGTSTLMDRKIQSLHSWKCAVPSSSLL